MTFNDFETTQVHVSHHIHTRDMTISKTLHSIRMVQKTTEWAS